MKTILKIEELSGDRLLAAVQQALVKSYTDLSFQLGELSLAQLQDYLEARPEIDLGTGFDDNSDDIRAAILAHHEPLLPGEDDILGACDDDIWPLCERILENHGYAMSRRVSLEGGGRKMVWRVEVENERFYVLGETLREGVLRCYVKDKLGNQVTLAG